MTICMFQLADRVLWRVAAADPAVHTLEPFLSAKILNPRQYAAPIHGEQMWGPWILADGDVVFPTSELLLELDGAARPDPSAAMEAVSGFVAAVRHVSGQFQIPAVARVVAFMPSWTGRTGPSWPRPGLNGAVRRSLIQNAAPFSLVPEAVGVACAGGPPAWSVFFLDALRAREAGDWKMALLLAALAAETGVGEALAEWHILKLSMTPRPPGVVDLRNPDGTVRPADPAYDALCERTSFRLALHERPLHLAGRSLLLNDKPTFDTVMRLYTTRNKIAHLGSPAASDTKSFALVQGDVEVAVDGAARCLAFFGRRVSARVDRGPFVEVKMGDFEADALAT